MKYPETGPNQTGLFLKERMLKKILSASLVILQILTQSASAFEFHPVVHPVVVQSIPAQPLQISPDILKNKMSFSGVNDFLFFKISDSFVNQPLVFDQGLSFLSDETANKKLSSLSGWRLTGAYLRLLTQARLKMKPLVVILT